MALLGFPCRYGSFYGWESRDRVPDHSWLSRTRARLPHEVHTAIFDWVLALIAEAGLVKGERIGGRCLDHGGQRGAAQHRAEGHGRGLPGDAGALGPGERHRDTHGRGPGAPGPQAQGQEALEPGLDLEERPRGQDRQDEGRHDPSGLQARARGGSGHRRGGGRRATPRPTRATRRRWRRRWRRPRRISRRWTRHRRPKTRPNV